MKFISAALALAGLVAAQEIQSKPFTLKLSSEDKTWDGKGVSSCHVGAAFESLCIGDHSELFHFNTTTGAQPAAEGYTPAGVLAWTLPTNPPFDEAMSLGFSPSSNVAIALFQPSYTSTYVSFEDKTGEMVIFSYIDDTVTPPKYATKALSQWYVCLNNYSGYQYNNLNWVVGGKPQNPSCSAVTVHRIFA